MNAEDKKLIEEAERLGFEGAPWVPLTAYRFVAKLAARLRTVLEANEALARVHVEVVERLTDENLKLSRGLEELRAAHDEAVVDLLTLKQQRRDDAEWARGVVAYLESKR
jgi:hypothetical protein